MATAPDHNRTIRNQWFEDRQGVTLEQWIQWQRDAGVPWRQIPVRLANITDNVIVVSHQTVMNWARED